MDYEEKYKKALATARKLYNMRGDWTNLEIESIFPELRESEDERIRKCIIGVLSTYEHDRDLRNAAIAWLEKQSNKPQGKTALEASKEEKVDNQNCVKPADKIEPKFKVEKDKWYVCTSQYCNCIEGRNYKASLDGRIIDDYGTEYDMHDDAYRWFRPWGLSKMQKKKS